MGRTYDMLDEAGRKRVAAAIADAERGTTGEIVCIVARAASEYRSWALFLAASAGFATPGVLLLTTGWGAGRIWLAQIIVTALLGAVLAWRPARMALTPGFLKRERAREAAHRQFAARGLSATSGRTGVLIFLAAGEHYVEVIADEGVASCVEEAAWRTAVDDLVGAIQADRVADGLVAVVTRIGAVLALHHPALPGQKENELADHVILL